MSKSLKRVIAALKAAGVSSVPVDLGDCRTAQDAAASVGCHVDQIAKSIIFRKSEGCALFLTAGGSRVDTTSVSNLAREPLSRADAETVRRITWFAIGGVSPLGHLSRSPIWIDRHLLSFDVVWAAAGTPRHVFAIAPDLLQRITGATVADFTYKT